MRAVEALDLLALKRSLLPELGDHDVLLRAVDHGPKDRQNRKGILWQLLGGKIPDEPEVLFQVKFARDAASLKERLASGTSLIVMLQTPRREGAVNR